MVKSVLVAIDLEHDAGHAALLGFAKDVADANGADVHLVSVVASAPAIVSQFLEKNYEKMASGQAGQALAKIGETVELESGKVATVIRFGVIYDEVIAAAKQLGTDLIVIGSHKPDFGDYLLGSNAARVVRHADCSVLVVRLPKES